jgi:predicted TIM-barrel fold metal-dependent hydrolase
MPYAMGRTIHDADAHVMETAEWVRSYADPDVRERMVPLRHTAVHRDTDEADRIIDGWLRRSHDDPELRASEAADIMNRKNWKATGALDAGDRSRALDHLGFETQLLFNSFHNGYLLGLEQRPDADPALVYGAARAHNRAMVDFCSGDARLLPTGYVPLVDPDITVAFCTEVIDQGAAALLIASQCPRNHSPSHVALDPVWFQAEEAGIPVVFHVGGGGPLLSPAYFTNGLPTPPDFHGGDENFRSVSYMAIAGPPTQTLATLILDGVLERYPELRFGVIEQGAAWVPSFMQQLESAMVAFARHEERLRQLTLRASDYVRRQVRVTPHPTEDVGWIIDQVGPDVCLFSSDYPHVEGGRHPVERFEASLGDRSEDIRQQFYCDNFVDLMGAAMPVLV